MPTLVTITVLAGGKLEIEVDLGQVGGKYSVEKDVAEGLANEILVQRYGYFPVQERDFPRVQTIEIEGAV